MIGALIRLDVALLRRSKAFWALLILLLVAAAFALVSGMDWRERYVGAAEMAREQTKQDSLLLAQIYTDIETGVRQPTDGDNYDGVSEYIPDPRDPYVAGYYHRQLVELPAGELLGLATGSTELRGTHHTIRSVPVATLVRVGEPAERVNPGALAAGRFDLLAFIIYLCPLALVVLLFDAVAREREGGQAALLAGLGPSRRELLLARGITRGAVVLAIALTASVVGLVLLGELFSSAGAAWLLGTTVYLLFWTTLLLAVATLNLGVVGSAAVAVAAWLVLLLVSPGLVERALRPAGLLEPRILADAEVRRVEREITASDAARAAAKERVAREYWNVDFDKAPPCANREGVLRDYVVRRLSDETYAAATRTAREREALYDQRLDSWGFLSPVLAFRRSMEAVAGVQPARQRAFEAQAIGFHARWRDRVTDAIFGCHRFSRADFEQAPRFTWRELPRRSGTWLGFAFVALLFILLGWAAIRPQSLFE